MKTYILSFALAIFAIGFTSCDKEMSAETAVTCCSKDDCCKNCDDEECKTTCKAVAKLSSEEAQSTEGKELIEKCKTLCEKNDCCKDSKKCSAHDKKAAAAAHATCCSNNDFCKNCDDEECKTTCESVGKLSSEEAQSAKGKELIAKCKTLCEKNECCKNSDQCAKHDKKSCCKK